MVTGGGLVLIADALTVHAGARVTSKHDSPPFRPRRVTRVWTNSRRTIVRFWVHSLNAWVDSEGVELPPSGKVWSDDLLEWVDPPPKESALRAESFVAPAATAGVR